MAGRKTDAQILDEVLAERAMGKAGDPLAEAKQLLGRLPTTSGGAPTESQATRDVMSRVERPAVMRYGPVVGQTAEMLSLPLAFASGPIGAIAGGSLLANDLPELIRHPSALGVGGAALAAIPALRAFGRMGGAAAKEAPVLLRGAEEFADVAGRQPVSRAAGEAFDLTGNSGRVSYGRPTEFNPTEASFERYMPNTSSVPPSGAPARAAFNTQTPELMSDVGETVSAPGFDLGDIVDAPLSVGAERAARRRQQVEEALQGFRKRQAEGTAGFRQLPQMSDAETARISASIDRIMGR